MWVRELLIVCFDGAGKIVAEIGEESTPGPVERLDVEKRCQLEMLVCGCL